MSGSVTLIHRRLVGRRRHWGFGRKTRNDCLSRWTCSPRSCDCSWSYQGSESLGWHCAAFWSSPKYPPSFFVPSRWTSSARSV